MKKQFLTIVVLLSISLAHASHAPALTRASKTPAKIPDVAAVECTFTAAVTLNILGQTASITCTSTKTACDGAINEVALCVKIAKKKLTTVLGL